MSQRDNQRWQYNFTILIALHSAVFVGMARACEYLSCGAAIQLAPWKKITVPARLPIFTNDPNEMKVRITKVLIRGLSNLRLRRGTIELLFSRVDCKRWRSKG
jgi:hypothetical protein